MKHKDDHPGLYQEASGDATSIDPGHPFCVGSWRIEPRAHQVEGPEGRRRLTPKAMRVLCCLAALPGHVGTKDELLDTVWEGTVVTESVLPRAISELRKTLGDDASNPHIIETIPTVGYRLVAPVTLPDPVVSLASRPDRGPEPPSGKLSPSIVLALLGGVLLTGLAGFALWQSHRNVAFEMEGFLTLNARMGIEHASSTSPDGKLIAIVEDREEQGRFDLYIKPEGGNTAFRLTDTSEKERSPTWSRDGRAIGFVQTTATTCSLNIISATGGAVQRLSGCEPGLSYQLKWSEDNTWLALVELCSQRKPARITMVPVHSQSRRPSLAPQLLMLQ